MDSKFISFRVPPQKQEKRKCRDPGSNRGPSDLQSDALPTELSRLRIKSEAEAISPPPKFCKQFQFSDVFFAFV